MSIGDAHQQLYLDYARLFNFVNSLLDPERFGYAVTAEVRDEARVALGREKVEIRQPTVPEPKPYEQNFGSVYCQVQRDELERNDK